MRKWWLSLALGIIMLFCHSANGQSGGTVKFIVNPGHDYAVKFDNDSIARVRSCHLPNGAHHIQIWAPGYDIFDTLLVVNEGEEHVVKAMLRHPQEWNTWRKESKSFTVQQGWQKVGLIGANVLFVGNAVYQWNRYKTLHNNIERITELYDATYDPSEIQELKIDLSQNQDKMKRQQWVTYSSLGASVVTTVAMSWLLWKAGQKEAPVYEDKAKVRFYAGAGQTGYNSSNMELGLTWSVRF
ncbi:MAG: hypothetical protein KDC12_07015 [Flavobacteriales bacterium]|nr:hypothetical protein [Flavobacteriales bacterium]